MPGAIEHVTQLSYTHSTDGNSSNINNLSEDSASVKFKGNSPIIERQFLNALSSMAPRLTNLEVRLPIDEEQITHELIQRLEEMEFPQLQKIFVTGSAELVQKIATKTAAQIEQATQLTYIHSDIPEYVLDGSPEDAFFIVKLRGSPAVSQSFIDALQVACQKLEVLQITLPIHEHEITPTLIHAFDVIELHSLKKLIVTGSADLAQAIVSKTSDALDTFILTSDGSLDRDAAQLKACVDLLKSSLSTCALNIKGTLELICFILTRVAKQLHVLECFVTSGWLPGAVESLRNMRTDIIARQEQSTIGFTTESSDELKTTDEVCLFPKLSHLVLRDQILSLPLLCGLLDCFCSKSLHYLELYRLSLLPQDLVSDSLFVPLQKAVNVLYVFFQAISLSTKTLEVDILKRLLHTPTLFAQAKTIVLEGSQPLNQDTALIEVMNQRATQGAGIRLSTHRVGLLFPKLVESGLFAQNDRTVLPLLADDYRLHRPEHHSHNAHR